ncbi:hypothetical protein M9Y10_006559 [Tritrichomonas musculus]|uniref:Uncharacterized protein n=1 Tax=Tritrichomonas musculus TaxID=1915356 RepID=A0ABR2JF03_9EUKA
MTLNTRLYENLYEEEECITMSVNDFGDDDPLGQEPAVNDTTTPGAQDLTYKRWQIFDEIPERIYTKELKVTSIRTVCH